MPSHTCCRSFVIASSRWSLESDASPFKIYTHSPLIMNTSPMTTTCPLAKEQETGTEIVSSTPTGSELTSISLDIEKANVNDASSSAVDASPKAKTMKEVLLRCGRGLAVAVVIALAGKGFVARAHNDLTGTDDMMNADLGIDSSKQVALLRGWK